MTDAKPSTKRNAQQYRLPLSSLHAMKIYCPKCRWEPTPEARWLCTCGHAWNTFETLGRCSRCGKVWRRTECMACHEWSLHHDWYHDLPPVEALLKPITRTIETESAWNPRA